MIKQRSSGSVK